MSAGSPCDGCHGRCCIEHRVPVDAFDVVRLGRARAGSWQELVELERVDHPLYFGFRLDGGSGAHWLFYLRRHASGACRFLVGPDGAQRCGVYEARPGACRTYPAALDDGRPMLSAHAICPPERAAGWRVRFAAGDRTALDDLALRERYAEALERWNLGVVGHTRTVDELLAFMADALDAA